MKRSWAVTPLAALLAALAIAVPFATAAEPQPGQVVNVGSSVWIAANGSQGKVRASNPNCYANREVLVKANGVGTVARAFTDDEGLWKANKSILYVKFSLPAKLYAVVPQDYQGTAGPIYNCLRSASRTVSIPTSAAEPGQTIRVNSNLWIANVAYQGRIRAGDDNCVSEREVLIRSDGRTVARTRTDADGFWRVDPSALYTSVELPAELHAVAGQVYQGTAGPIYQCNKAVSRTVTIP